MAERVLPHDLDAERAVLGAVIVDNASYVTAAGILTDQTFFRDAHHRIFRQMRRLAEANQPIDLLTLKDALERSGELEEVGGPAYLAALIDGVPRSTNVESYARIVKRTAAHRQVIIDAQHLLERAFAEGADPEELVADAVEAMHRTRDRLTTTTGGADLEFYSMPELAARVAAAGPRQYLFRGIFPAKDYGVHAAERKAQKTMNAADAAVSVASATPWLNAIPVDAPGPVLMFHGEGGEANLWRRLRGTAAARGLDAEQLPITVCCRVPHLANARHLALAEAQIARQRPALVILDPLYLSARGASGSDLYAMGALLETVQHICQRYGAALIVITHFNRKDGDGASRISGAGPAEWGRVLLSSTVKSRHTDPTTKETTVLTEMQVIGGEVPDQTLRILRRVRAVDPDDLNSELEIHTSVTALDYGETTNDPERSTVKLPPAAAKILEALRASATPTTQDAIVDAVVKTHGHGLKRETVSRHLNDLERRGLVESCDAGAFQPKLWKAITPDDPSCDPCDVTRDQSHECDRVTTRDLSLRRSRGTITRERSHEEAEDGDHTTEAPNVRI